MSAPTQAPPLRSVEEAVETILAAIPGPLPAESVSPERALGRFLATAAVARTDLPPWDNSAMDGYALRAVDTSGATDAAPVAFRVIGEVRAGEMSPVAVAPGTALRIATGAPLPPGADAVVPVELTSGLDADGRGAGPGLPMRDATGPLPAGVNVHAQIPIGGSVRARASDLRAGDEVLAAGIAMTPAAVALAAGAGIDAVSVHRRPRVAVLATGDEIRAAGQELGPAGIPDANGPGLRALVEAAGAEPLDLGIARDRLDDVESRLRRAIAEADVVIVSGGVSVGPYDVVRSAFEAIGRVDLWRVAVQPGKPFAFGVAQRPDPAGDGARRSLPAVLPAVLLFGLPGNPVSTAVTFELFVRPALRRLAGGRAASDSDDRGILQEPVSKSHGRRAYIRVVVDRDPSGRVRRDDGGRLSLRLAGGQGSHVLSALAAADALAIVLEEVDELPAGAEVAVHWLARG